MSFLRNLFKRKDKNTNNKEEKISFSELNEILVKKYNQKPLESSCFNFNIPNIKACVFEIEKIDVIALDDEIKEVFIVLNEITYGINFKLVLPLSDFWLLFKDFKISKQEKLNQNN